MAKFQKTPQEEKSSIKIARWDPNKSITQEEAEAHLHREGYESFCWYDVPGVHYPNHEHEMDECVWIIQGKMDFVISGETYRLEAGDRIYLPRHTEHQTNVTKKQSVTFLVGRKRG